MCLFIGEASKDVLEECLVPGYSFIAGRKLSSDKIRLNCFVQDTVQYDVEAWECEIPVVSIKIMGWCLIEVYREWQIPGTTGSMKINLQESRFRSLVDKLAEKNDKTCCLGDFNFDVLNVDSDYQRKFDKMREKMTDDLLLNGWCQLVTEPTRSLKGRNLATLDQIYTNSLDYVEGHLNSNIISTDHNMIGAVLSTKNPAFQRQVISYHIGSQSQESHEEGSDEDKK